MSVKKPILNSLIEENDIQKVIQRKVEEDIENIFFDECNYIFQSNQI